MFNFNSQDASLFPKNCNDHIFQNYVFIDRIDGAKPLSKRKASAQSTILPPTTTVTTTQGITKGKKISKLHKLKSKAKPETLPLNSILTITKGDEDKQVLEIHDGASIITENIEPAIEKQEWVFNEQIEQPLIVHSTSKVDTKVSDDLIKLFQDYQDNILMNQEKKKIIGFSDPDTKVLHITGMNQNNKPGAISLHLHKEDEEKSINPSKDSLNPVNSISIPQLTPQLRPTREPSKYPPSFHHLELPSSPTTQSQTPLIEVPSLPAAQAQNSSLIHHLDNPTTTPPKQPNVPIIHYLQNPSPPASQPQTPQLIQRPPTTPTKQNPPTVHHLEVPPPAAPQPQQPAVNSPPAVQSIIIPKQIRYPSVRQNNVPPSDKPIQQLSQKAPNAFIPILDQPLSQTAALVPSPPQTLPTSLPQTPVKQPSSSISSAPLTQPVVRKLTPTSPKVFSSQTFKNEPLKLPIDPPFPKHIGVPQKMPKTQLPLANEEDEQKHRIANAFAKFVLGSMRAKKPPVIIKDSAPKQVDPIDNRVQNKKNVVTLEKAEQIYKHNCDPKQPSRFTTIEEQILAILQDRQRSSNDENLRYINVLPHQKIVELPQDNFENIIINGETVKTSPENFDFIDDCEQSLPPVKLEPAVHAVQTEMQIVAPVPTVQRKVAPPLHLNYPNRANFRNHALPPNNEEEDYKKVIYREPLLTYYKYDPKEFDLLPASSSQQLWNTPIERLPPPHRQAPQAPLSQQPPIAHARPIPARQSSRLPSRPVPLRQPLPVRNQLPLREPLTLREPLPLRDASPAQSLPRLSARPLPLREPSPSRQLSRLPSQPLPPSPPQQQVLLRRSQSPSAVAPTRIIKYAHRQEQTNHAQLPELEDMDRSIEDVNDDEYLENLLNNQQVPLIHV